MAMVSLLNLFLDSSLGYSWRATSEIVVKSEQHGKTRAQSVRGWVLNFVHTRELPAHKLGRARHMVLVDEDVAHELKLSLSEKAKSDFVTASDVVAILPSPEMQAQFFRAGIHKPSITNCTARRWLSKLGWRYGSHKNGMYVDGHEHQDVVEYRQVFVGQFKEYECQFHAWDNMGNELPHSLGFPAPRAIGCFCLILVTHDKSMFYQNDQQKIYWGHPGGGTPKPKGEGISLMVSDFLTSEWGRLCNNDRCIVAASPPP